MTQYEQIVNAILKLGGKATFDEICNNLDLSSWNGKTPRNSVSRYLTCSSQITREKHDDKYYYIIDPSVPYTDLGVHKKIVNSTIIQQSSDNNDTDNDKNTNDTKDNGLYFICLSSEITLPVAGSVFIIGKSGNVTNRMYSYGSSLPFDPIRQIAFFPVPIELDLSLIEGELRATLISYEGLGITRYSGGRQKEWLQTLQYNIDNKNERNELVLRVNDILDSIIERKLDAMNSNIDNTKSK
jgi:hypothetical protein